MGLARMSPKKGDVFQELIKKADDLLYQARLEGRNRIVSYK